MNDFNYYLKKVGEIGFVEESLNCLVYASGLPNARCEEVVLFETQDVGQVLSLNPEQVEILLLSASKIEVGAKVVRTSEFLRVGVGEALLGRTVDPLGHPQDAKGEIKYTQFRDLDTPVPPILSRRTIETPFETGVRMVDLVVPLGKGQRELVIGDRKTGKTEFLLQTILNQANKGTVCIYAVVGQRQIEVRKLQEFFQQKGISEKCVIVASSSSDPSGLIFLTPYTAMSIAEFFRDKGEDVLIILDDMTTHARTYREISLLAKRFPGRGSYPGDIFYVQARLLERAGKFEKGSITCLPVAESILGDLSGYLQTNLMAMTDGHIFFDIDLFNQGKRPAINPFMSVTRVGYQTQSELARDVSRELLNFLVQYEKMKQFLHFGAEIGEVARNILNLGSKVDVFLNQDSETTTATNLNIFILSILWTGLWNEIKQDELKGQIERIELAYKTNEAVKSQIDKLVTSEKAFSGLVNTIRRNPELVTNNL